MQIAELIQRFRKNKTRRQKGVEPGKPDTVGENLKPLLSNAHIFGVDLYAAGIGDKIESMLRQELAGPGAVRETLKRWLPSGQRGIPGSHWRR